jgi:hypothetical protein
MSVLWYPKDSAFPRDWEDSACCDEQARLAAAADGASASFDGRGWSRHLVVCFAAFAPAILDGPGVERWVTQVQRSWKAEEPIRKRARPPMPVFVADQPDPPSGATLAAVRVSPGPSPRFDAVAVGDACVFQVRDDHPILCEPVATAAGFGSRPDLIMTTGSAPPVTYVAGQLRPGDLVFLATDALAAWLVERKEDAAAWAALAAMDQDRFDRFVEAQRSAGELVVDDVTLVRCRFAPAD